MYLKSNFSLVLLSIVLCIIFFPQKESFGASSQNYELSEEAFGAAETDASSASFQIKSTTGGIVSELSSSANYFVDQVRVWFSSSSSSSSGSSSSSSSGGSGGGGGGGSANVTGVNFIGRAYPSSRITLLKDGQLIATTIAGPDARFAISTSGLNSGKHSFILFGEDLQGIRSDSVYFPLVVTQGVTLQVSGIFLAPTLAVDKEIVKRGDNLAIFGQTSPESTVTIGVASEEETFRTVKSDKNGVFLYNLDTTPLERGAHETRAKAALNEEVSIFGKKVPFQVGDKNVTKILRTCPERGDLNNDCRVNLVDFSIAVFWYKKPLTQEGIVAKEAKALNHDGKINLLDLSVMAFNWTG